MADLVLKNCLVHGKITDIEILDGKISKIGKTDLDGIDISGKHVYPGLFDIHCHGANGFDTMDGDKLPEISEYLLRHGITAWLPTTMTMSMEDIKRATTMPVRSNGASILGFHMEGPYIAEKFKGAQNAKYIKAPNLDEFSKLENIKMVTLAPELAGSAEFIKKCGAVVSLGHTDCTYEQAISAIESGAKCLTHTFNAMPPLHHRNPGPIGAAADKNIYVQVICDGIHIHPAVIRILYKLFGKERMVLISDAMRATGLDDGVYSFGGQKIIVSQGIARTEQGALAGSTSTLMDCVKKAIDFGVPQEDAFFMATATPASLMHVNKGYIAEGYDADLIILDEKLNLCSVVANGEIRI